MNLSNYLRIPIKTGAKLAMATSTISGDGTAANFAAKDYFEILIDNLNHDILTNLRQKVAGEAFLLAFVRGSVVKNRLAVAQTYWPRLVDCFHLDEVGKELERSYGKASVENSLLAIRRKLDAELLRDRGELGPAKLLFRLKKPGAEIFSRSNYELIEAFIGEVSTLAQDCDESIRAFLYETDLGAARPSVKTQFDFLLRQFELDTIVHESEAAFAQFVQIQREARCLHPALPIAEEAVRRLAARFGINADLARQLIALFRFAWLCRLAQPKEFSDFTFKSVVVMPQAEETASAEVRRRAENALFAVFDTLKYAMISQPDLLQFSARYPEVRVKISAFVLSLPKPLFETFLAVDCGEDRLDFMMRYQMGPAYFQKYIAGLLHDAHYGKRLAAIDEKYGKQLSLNLGSLLDRSVYIKTKISKSGKLKYETISPFDISPQWIRELLKNAIEHPEGEHVEKCSWILNEISKDDFYGNIRGLWLVKKNDF